MDGGLGGNSLLGADWDKHKEFSFKKFRQTVNQWSYMPVTVGLPQKEEI
jgi:hypothetical protein